MATPTAAQRMAAWQDYFKKNPQAYQRWKQSKNTAPTNSPVANVATNTQTGVGSGLGHNQPMVTPTQAPVGVGHGIGAGMQHPPAASTAPNPADAAMAAKFNPTPVQQNGTPWKSFTFDNPQTQSQQVFNTLAKQNPDAAFAYMANSGDSGLSNSVQEAINAKYGQGVGSGLIGAYQPGGMERGSTNANMLGFQGGVTPSSQYGPAEIGLDSIKYGGQTYNTGVKDWSHTTQKGWANPNPMNLSGADLDAYNQYWDSRNKQNQDAQAQQQAANAAAYAKLGISA